MAKKKIPEGMENALPNVTADELAASRKASAAMPSWGDIKSAFGEDAVTTKKINLDPATPEGAKNRGKLLDMMMPAWQAEADRGMKFSERMEKKILYDKQGRKRVAPAEMADRIAYENNLSNHSGNTVGYSRAYSNAPYWDMKESH